MMTTSDLHTDEFDPYYSRYINKVDRSKDLLSALVDGKHIVEAFFNSIPYDKHDFSYQEEKWSIKEVLQHMVDAERVFTYRCFRIARHDQTPLAGFDQNIYIKPSAASQKSMANLMNEFAVNREATISLIKSLSSHDLAQMGVANESPISARATAFCIVGHDIWHMNIIKERYL